MSRTAMRTTKVGDPRRLISHEVRCCGGCGSTRMAERMGAIWVGWCDLCWQRCVVRRVKAGDPPGWYRAEPEEAV